MWEEKLQYSYNKHTNHVMIRMLSVWLALFAPPKWYHSSAYLTQHTHTHTSIHHNLNENPNTEMLSIWRFKWTEKSERPYFSIFQFDRIWITFDNNCSENCSPRFHFLSIVFLQRIFAYSPTAQPIMMYRQQRTAAAALYQRKHKLRTYTKRLLNDTRNLNRLCDTEVLLNSTYVDTWCIWESFFFLAFATSARIRIVRKYFITSIHSIRKQSEYLYMYGIYIYAFASVQLV